MDLKITDVPGIRAGHDTDREGATGCTVILCDPEGAVAGVDVRGSAPGTRETDLLKPGAMVERIHALCFAGGSAFGLAAADGVMAHLQERGVGLDVGFARVPIVPAAVIFDLGTGTGARPDRASGLRASLAAEAGRAIEEGAVGAGTGATVGKFLGPAGAMPGGVGSAGVKVGGVTVGALAVVNAMGDVIDADGSIIAGARRADGSFVNTSQALLAGEKRAGREAFGAFANTTLGVVATDAALTKAQCQKLAELAQDALALAVRPVHTTTDGDTVFALSTGTGPVDMLCLGAAAVEALSLAIRRAVRR